MFINKAEVKKMRISNKLQGFSDQNGWQMIKNNFFQICRRFCVISLSLSLKLILLAFVIMYSSSSVLYYLQSCPSSSSLCKLYILPVALANCHSLILNVMLVCRFYSLNESNMKDISLKKICSRMVLHHSHFKAKVFSSLFSRMTMNSEKLIIFGFN